LSSPSSENIPLAGLLETPLGNPPSDPTEGRFANVTDAGLDAMDAEARETGDADADGKIVWS
jgi:hypothetical protein